MLPPIASELHRSLRERERRALDAWLRKRLCCDRESLFSSFSSESPRRLAAEGALWCRPRAADRTALAFHLGGMRPCLRLTRQVARSTRSRAPSSRTTTSMPPPAMGLAAHRGMARWSAALALAHSPSPSPEQLAVLLTNHPIYSQLNGAELAVEHIDPTTQHDASFYRLHKQVLLTITMAEAQPVILLTTDCPAHYSLLTAHCSLLTTHLLLQLTTCSGRARPTRTQPSELCSSCSPSC